MSGFRTKISRFAAFVAIAMLFAAGAGAAEPAGEYSGDPYADLASYSVNGSRQALAAIEAEIRKAAPADVAPIEAKLLRILSEAKATADARRAVCRLLRQVGGAASVPALSNLLTDKGLSHMARFALQGMACSEAGAALREALGKVDGDLKIGVIGSLGARRDRQAVSALAALVNSKEPGVARAAVSALGRIGGAEAARALEAAPATPDLNEMKTEARLMCADSMLAEGDAAGAAAVYRSAMDKKTPAPMRIAACRGLARADKRAAAQTVVSMLHDESPLIRRAAGALAAEVPGQEATKAFVADLPSLAPDAQAALLAALSDRGDKAALPSVVQAVQSSDATVRVAALQALGALGDASCVRLLASAATANDEAGKAAMESLVRLKGSEASAAMREIMESKEDAAIRRQVIEAAKARNDVSAAPALLRVAGGDADSAARLDAMEALGALAGPDQAPAIVALMTPERSQAEQRALQKALSSIANRAENRDVVAAPIFAALGRGDGAMRQSLLAALGRVGGAAALEAIRAELKSQDPEARKAALRALAGWPEWTPMDELPDLARSDADPVCRTLALRAYVALLRLPSSRPAEETVRLCREAMTLATSADEKRLILSGLAEVPSPDALRAVESYLSDSELQAEAKAAQAKITRLLEPKKAKEKGKASAPAKAAVKPRRAKSQSDEQGR